VCAACPGRAVELVTARALAAGDALTLDYGARPLRALLQGYAFVPADAAFASPSEVRPAHLPPAALAHAMHGLVSGEPRTRARCCPHAPSYTEPC